jgi:hypothetical protein
MCDNLAKYRYTWPGQDEALICEEHVGKLRGVASALGLYLQIISLSEETGSLCHQKTS